MAAENTELLDAMADQISTALVLSEIPIQVYGRYVAAPGSYPCVDMYPGDVSRGVDAAAFGLRGEYRFTVRVRVQTNDADANQELLLNMMDDTNTLSVPMALLDEPTLNGLATSLDVIDATGYVPYLVGEDSSLGFQFTAMVIRAES